MRSTPNELEWSRFAYTVSKRVGNAVVRNKVRRRLREVVRALALRPGFDVVITARPPAAQSDFAHLQSELTLLCKRAKLLQSE